MTTETPTKTTKVDPSNLVPDFENIPGEAVADEHTFWLGVTTDFPQGQIDVAGLHFSKHEEQIVTNPAGDQVRNPVFGSINRGVTKHHFKELVKVLPRLVVRFTKPVEQDSTGKNIGDPVSQAKGHLIKIPNEAMMVGAETHGRKLKPYVQRPGDRPASEFMYFAYAPNGARGAEVPKTIAEIGLEWPGELQLQEDLSELLS